jgi:hypothetical protein
MAAKPPELLVIMPVKDWVCARCTGAGGLLTMDDAGPLCLTCADLDHLVFLGAGDAALTRRAKKASGLSTVVVRWSRSRKRYERQGILIEEAALEQAEQECLADEDARMRLCHLGVDPSAILSVAGATLRAMDTLSNPVATEPESPLTEAGQAALRVPAAIPRKWDRCTMIV